MGERDKRGDSELIRAIINGDREAFESLVLRYEKSVCNLIHSITRDPSYVDDLAQEIFWRVYLNLKRFKGKSSFKTWLYRIAVNECLKELKQAASFSKFKARLKDEKKGLPLIPDSEKFDLDEILLKSEEQAKIRELVNSLPLLHRLILSLHYYEGLSIKEIAQILNCPSGTIRSRLHNARNKLKELLLPFIREDGENV